MKLKKAIGAGVLTCCLAVMGMFSFGALHTEAAICKHTIMQGELFESHSGTDYTMKCSICGFSK